MFKKWWMLLLKTYRKIIQRRHQKNMKVCCGSSMGSCLASLPLFIPPWPRDRSQYKNHFRWCDLLLPFLGNHQKEDEKVNLYSTDWFFQSSQQYLVDYMCPIFGGEKLELQLKRDIFEKNKIKWHYSWCWHKREHRAINQSPMWVSPKLSCWVKKRNHGSLKC